LRCLQKWFTCYWNGGQLWPTKSTAASSDGDRSIVRAILRAGPPGTVYKKDSSGLSALHVAARMGHHRVVTDMLGSCPDAAELRDGNSGTFVHTAAREKRS